MDINRWKFYDNFILITETKTYCLVCNEHFKNERKIIKHIRKSLHLNKAAKINPIPEYEEEKIYEFPDWCYCKYCNKRINQNLVHFHVTDLEYHKRAKRSCEKLLASPSSDDVDRYEFSGIIKGICYVCDNKVVNSGEEEDHIKGSGHRVNLAQCSNVQDLGYGSYREVKDKFICYLCREVYPLTQKEGHFITKKHMSIALTKVTQNPQVHPSTSMSREERRAEIAYQVSLKKIAATAEIFETQKDFYEYNTELFKATCKMCRQLIDIDCKAMLDHRKGHESEISKTAESKEKFTVEYPPEPYTNENNGKHRRFTKCISKYLSIDNVHNGRYFFCRVCYVYISPKANQVIQHILGVSHREIVYANNNRNTKQVYKNANLITIWPYVKTIYHVPELEMYLINGICIEKRSFLLVDTVSDKTKKHQGKMVCYVCEETFPVDEEMDHYESVSHYRSFLSGQIVKTFKDEFIREIPYDIFHCGYCNKIMSSRVLNKHLGTWKHQKAKQKHLAMSNLVSSWYGLGTYVSHMSYPELYAFIVTSVEQIMCMLKN